MIELRSKQFAKQLSQSLVMLRGMMIDSSEEQPENVDLLMMLNLQTDSKTMPVKLVQLSKALLPMMLHVLGIRTDESDVQLLNVKLPIDVTKSIDKELSLAQFLNELLCRTTGQFSVNDLRFLPMNVPSSMTSTVEPDENVMFSSGIPMNESDLMTLMCMFDGTMTVLMFGASPKQYELMTENESEMQNSISETQPMKTLSPIVVNLECRSKMTSLRFLQFSKQLSPIVVQLGGMLMRSRETQSLNVCEPRILSETN